MLKLFRKLRLNMFGHSGSNESKKNLSPVGKYLIYAIGEILLVMIGILLALQVNNWNENKKLIAKENKIVQALYAEMQMNHSYLENVLEDQIPRAESYSRMYLQHTGLKGMPISSDTFNYYLTSIATPHFNPRDVKFDQVVNGEDFDFIRNDSLRTLLGEYKVRIEYAEAMHNSARANWEKINEYMNQNYSLRRTATISKVLYRRLKDLGDTSFEMDLDVVLKDPYFENIMTERLGKLGFWENRAYQLYEHCKLTIEYMKEHYDLD